MRSLMSGTLLLWMVAGAAPSGAVADQISPDSPPCILLFGGGGTITPDANVNHRWSVIDSLVTGNARSGLVERGFNVRQYFSDIEDPQQRFQALVGQLNDTRCTKVVQIDHVLKGANAISQFGFSATIIHLTPKPTGAGTAYTVVGEYSREYDYPLTAEVMRTLSLSDVATKIVTDIDASGVLANMKSTPTAPKPGP